MKKLNRERVCWVVLTVSVFLAPCFEAAAQAGAIRVKVMDCEINVPSSYVVEAREFGSVIFKDYSLTSEAESVGSIVIKAFDGYSDRYDVVNEESHGSLVTADFVNHRQWPSPDYDMTIIRNDKYIISLIGKARTFKDDFVKACLASQPKK
ncbi:MAG: hypothetical protein ACI8W3_001081 [Myxococcota bacterium]|jgi:hypothetical protein